MNTQPTTTTITQQEYKRGEIWFASLGDNNEGSEQSGERGVVILSNNTGNRHSSTVIVAAISTARKQMPTHVPLDTSDGVLRDSFVLMEQIRTISKTRLKKRISKVQDSTMSNIEDKLLFSCGISLKHPSSGRK